MPDLKLLALDSEDLDVISATTQDAVVRVGDIGFAKADHRFALLMNRFAWEEDGRTKQRKRTALHFDRVKEVKVSGIDLNAVDGVLELLAIRFTASEAPAGDIDLDFAGGGTIRLGVEYLEGRMQDLGAAWAAKGTPEHSA
jgi:hypothetical protein